MPPGGSPRTASQSTAASSSASTSPRRPLRQIGECVCVREGREPQREVRGGAHCARARRAPAKAGAWRGCRRRSPSPLPQHLAKRPVHAQGVAAHQVQAHGLQLHALVQVEGALKGVLQHQVAHAVIALERAHQAAPLQGHHHHHLAQQRLQALHWEGAGGGGARGWRPRGALRALRGAAGEAGAAGKAGTGSARRSASAQWRLGVASCGARAGEAAAGRRPGR